MELTASFRETDTLPASGLQAALEQVQNDPISAIIPL